MKRTPYILAAGVILAAVVGAYAAPAKYPWDITTTTIWADTLPRGFTADSAVYSSPIPVFGARAIIIDASTSGAGGITNDTLSVGHPIFDVTGTGNYTGAGGQGCIQGFEVPTGGAIGANGTQIYLIYSSYGGVQAGTPVPMTTRSIKFRMKGGNARRYNTASSATLAPTGTITVRVHVVR